MFFLSTRFSISEASVRFNRENEDTIEIRQFVQFIIHSSDKPYQRLTCCNETALEYNKKVAEQSKYTTII